MRIQTNNFSMAFEARGEGLPILFIHGYPLNSRMWEPQLAELSRVAQVIAPDLRGHGQSEPSPGHWSLPEPYTMDSLAADCVALLDALHITRPVVVCGLSMGGYVSFAIWRQYPERVAALILAATRASADSPEGQAKREAAIELARQGGPKAIAESMLPLMLSPKTYATQPELVARVMSIMLETSVNGIIGALMGMKIRPDSTPILTSINVPTLILHGADDQIIPLDENQALRDAIDGARLEIIPEAGHLLNLEQPERFNTALRDFLSL